MCFDFVYNICLKHFSFQELSDVLSKTYIGLHVKYPLFLFVQWEPYCSMRTDRDDEFLISNSRRVVNVVWFLLGNSPASELYMPTFRNAVPSS
jgi:hypothetical protein